MALRNVNVFAQWDDIARVYCASSDDINGLALEAPTLEQLEERLRQAVPELIEINARPVAEATQEKPPIIITLSATRTCTTV